MIVDYMHWPRLNPWKLQPGAIIQDRPTWGSHKYTVAEPPAWAVPGLVYLVRDDGLELAYEPWVLEDKYMEAQS